MPPRTGRDQSKPRSRHVSVCVSLSFLGANLIVSCHQPEGGSRKEYDSDPSGLTVSALHQWRDLLDPDLSPMDVDAALSGVLRSTTETEKIKGSGGAELQRVIDVLGKVRPLLN